MVIRLKEGMLVALAGAAASVIPMGSPASAQSIVVVSPPVPNLRVQRVSYWDLNLATRSGEQTLHRRVGNAVENVCLYDRGVWYGLSAPDYNFCAARAWSRARPQMIGAVYRARQQYGYYPGY